MNVDVNALVTLSVFKTRASEMCRRAKQGAPVVVTRHGAPTAVLISVDDFGELQRLREKLEPGVADQ